ncbi:MAG TPA: hypothetical protein VHV30_09480, partial [Polyangiaceae bacterium]|nr:hypothetical protein [Polyangiaceae bacterium]
MLLGGKKRWISARLLPRLGLTAWFIVMTVVAATLLGRHLLALPRPVADAAMERAMSSLRGADGAGRWMAVHVLYAECLCSKRVADHVLSDPRPGDLAERVLLIGHDSELEARLAAGHFATTEVTEEEAADRFHVVAAPALVVVDPTGSVQYSGGYTDRKQSLD